MNENPYKSPEQYGAYFGRRPNSLLRLLSFSLAIPTALFGTYGVGMGVYKSFFEHGLWMGNGLVALSVGTVSLVAAYVLFRLASLFKSSDEVADSQPPPS